MKQIFDNIHKLLISLEESFIELKIKVEEQIELKIKVEEQTEDKKIDTHKYITSASDVAPWQYYIDEHNRILKFYKIYMNENFMRLCTDSGEAIEIYRTSVLDENKFRVAKIHEIPEHCLIGKKVRAWDTDYSKSENVCGILVNVYRDDAYPYTICDVDDRGTRYHYKNIELIDDSINY